MTFVKKFKEFSSSVRCQKYNIFLLSIKRNIEDQKIIIMTAYDHKLQVNVTKKTFKVAIKINVNNEENSDRKYIMRVMVKKKHNNARRD